MILVCLFIQGFYAMMEMSCVSFNKVRLQYYVSKHNRRAQWLSYLLNHPAQLFGTTLIGVNSALQFGSESARHFYISLGLSPDWAPLSQTILVLMFAEISPLLAGRRYAENAAMLGVPVLYFSSLILRPIIWLFDILCVAINRLVGSPGHGGLYLSREELQKILEDKEEVRPQKEEKEAFTSIIANIFSLKNMNAKELMHPLKSVHLASSVATIAELRRELTSSYTPFVPIYHRNQQNIVAIAYPRDLLRVPENKRVREYSRPPWFITESTSILQILKQFQRNNQSLAVVLNEAGLATGILTLDEVIDEIFGRTDEWESLGEIIPRVYHVVVDKTFPGDMMVADFNRQFNVHLEFEDEDTLKDLVEKSLGHPPSKGESIHIDQFELTVEEATLLGATMISVRTVY